MPTPDETPNRAGRSSLRPVTLSKTRGPLAGYAVAVAAVAVTLALRHALAPVLGGETPFITLFPAVVFAAWYAGTRPALLATALGAVAVYLTGGPVGGLDPQALVETVPYALFAVMGAFISVLVGRGEAARRSLASEQERLTVTLASIGDGVLVTDADVRVTYLNAEAERLTGWTLAEAAGRHLDEVFCILNESTRAVVPCPVRKVLETGRVVGLANHTVLLARGGGERPIDDSAAPVRDRSGAVLGVVLVFRDITERQLAEQGREERGRLAALGADVGLALTRSDTLRGVLDDCAKSLVARLDGALARVWTMNEAGDTLELQASAGLYTHLDGPHGRVRVGEYKIGLIAREREPHLTNSVQGDPRVPEQAWARREGLVAFAGYPLVVADRVVGVMALFARRPLSEATLQAMASVASEVALGIGRKQGEARLRESEARLRLATQAAGLGIYEWHVAEDVVAWENDRVYEIFGQARGDDTINAARFAAEFVHPDDAASLAGAIAEALRGDHFHWLGRFRRKGGEVRWVEFTGRVERSADGAPLRMPGTVADVTERVRADEALKASEGRTVGILENLNEGFVVLDAGWRFSYLNAAAERMNAHRRDEVLGRSHWEVFPASVGTVVEREFRRVAAEGTTAEFESHYIPWGRWFAIKAYPAPGGGICVQFRDVTDAKRAADAMRESESRFRQLAETIPQLAWMARPDGHIFWYNRRWHEYAGTTAAEMEGWGWRSVHDPDTLPAVLERWGHSIATGEPFSMVFPLRGRDGTFRPFLTLVNPLRDAAGAILFWFGTNTDIGEQKRVEEELARVAESERCRSDLLARVADASRSVNAVLSVDSITRTLVEEARHILGVHVSVTSLTRDAEHAQVVQAVSLSDKYAEFRGRELRPDGLSDYVCRTNRPLRLSEAEVAAHPEWDGGGGGEVAPLPTRGWLGVPLIGHGGKNLGLIQVSDKYDGELSEEDEAVLIQLAALASVSVENARLYDALRDQDRRKDEFLATLAHELRNPLAPVRMGLQVILSTGGLTGPAARTRDMMERQVGHMARLIDDLMDVSRVSSGKVELRRERLTLRAVFEAAVEASRPLMDAARHELTVTLPDEPLTVDADLTRLAQVVSNLLNNAAKYTPEGGRVTLSAEADGAEVLIRVSDTGAGIPAEMLSKVFDLFTQVGRTIDRSQGGLGIGLSLVRRLVEMHGGSVAADSRGPGRGSTFTVRLPLAPGCGQRAAGGGVLTAGEPTWVPPAGRKILVVDDDVDGAESLAMLLEAYGHETQVAHSGPGALAAVREFGPEAVFLDIGLPGMNGYEVAKRLRADPGLGVTVLVAITGWGSEEDRRQSKEAGFDHHLTKPADPAALLNILATLSPPSRVSAVTP